MKKISSLLMALLLTAVMLLSSCKGDVSSNTPQTPLVPEEQRQQINIPNLEETYTDAVTASFSATFSENDFDSFPDRQGELVYADGVGVEASDEGYVDIMPIVKELCDDLSKIGYLEVTVTATDSSKWTNTRNNKEIKPTYQFHENDRSGSSIKSVHAVTEAGSATTITVPVPDDTYGLVFLPYGFNPEAGKIEFTLSIRALITVKYERAYENSVVMLTGSDFQCWGDEATVVSAYMKTILENVDDDIVFDGFLFCGDYDASTVGDLTETDKGLDGLDAFISDYIADDDKVYVKGNHDHADGSKLTPSGANDTDEYGVFVINESDYMWYNSDEEPVKLAAQNLIDYLNEKLEAKYDKPIFIASHLPLHYTMRTRQDGDGRYAHYFFDPLNEAAAKGLNIVFLYGHDHSNSWDDYLGGSAVFLTKGDSINISYGEKEEHKVQTLNFTYMNAGFVGYYDLNNEGAFTNLNMGIIEITDATMAFSRVSAGGIEPLKAKGVRNDYKSETGYDPDETERQSYFEIELTKVTNTKKIKDILKDAAAEAPKEPHYTRVTKVEDLKDGERYLFVVQQRGEENYFVMAPNVVTKSGGSGTRVGFELMSASHFNEANVVSGRLDIREWTLKKSGDGWMLSDGERFVHLEQTEDTAITATLEDQGDILTIKKSGSRFEISNGEFYLNHNTSRGLVNGYPSEPAYIYIYTYVE